MQLRSLYKSCAGQAAAAGRLDMQVNTSNATTAATATTTTLQYPYYEDGPLRKVHPYNHTYLTYAKARWIGRQILEIFSTEFRDRSKDFYAWAISTGTVMVNGQVVDANYIIENGDLISNVMHRHEPPILGGKIKIYHRDDESGIWVVEKKASMPIHPTGRFRKNTLLEVLKNEYGLTHVNTANRLDRLVSGIMIITTTTPAAQKLGKAFQTPGAVKKEYVARVKGCFPEGEEVVCDEPLLTIDRQIGVNVVHPEGRPSKTLFKRLSYDPETDTSVVRCRPITGRSHQLRVHLQFLGHPIANDPIYSDTNAWGESGGKGGIFPLVDKKTATKVEAPEYKPISEAQEEAVEKMKEALTATFITSRTASSSSLKDEDTIIPSEDVSGVNTPLEPSTPLSAPSPSSSSASLSGTEGDKSQAGDTPKAKIVLRRERKESRRREGGGVNRPRDLAEFKIRYPEFNARKGAPQLNDDSTLQGGSEITLVPQAIHAINHLRKVRDEEDEYARYRDMEKPPMPPVLPSASSSNKGSSLNVNKEKATNRPQTAKRGVKNMSSKEREILAEEVRSEELIRLQEGNPEYYVAKEDNGARHCNVCGTPLLPDPKVEQLSIWLHAMRYYTEDWDYSSPLPDWARVDWKKAETVHTTSATSPGGVDI